MKDAMTKKMLIDATHAEETRVVVVDGNKVEEFDFESLNKRQLAGNIYLAKVIRVEPSLQAAFVDYGGNRHGFLAFSEIHPDYYQIPKADREALLREEAEAAREEEEAAAKPKPRSRSRSRKPAQPLVEGAPATGDAVIASEDILPEGLADAPIPGEPQSGDRPLDDLPPPSAASGELEIAVAEEPAFEPAEASAEAAQPQARDASPEDEAAAPAEYESVGGDDVAEERAAPRRPRARRYKIQEVIKVRQILLVQVVKEERGNKGAALTTYLSLAGRYCVLMPNTARGGGISRKITNAADRKKLKEISSSITVPEGAGLIIRTAGAARTKTEIKRDYEFLLRQWEQIRDLTLKSIAPAPIYEEGSLIKRAIRDLYSREMDEILVDGERGYREAKDYMKMLMPSHAKNVKHYADAMPLFSKFQVESYLSAMFNPVVQLKSGGYIVIDVTEALVAIDVNSGRATREASIEDTALKTNLEAAEEAARQMRLRDLAGLIVIDFIDMEDRRNNAAVEKRLKEKLKSDRARIQLGRISGFGLMEMSRQRLRPGMIEATTKACPHCHGTGRVRSDDSLALAMLREIEEEGVRQRSKEVLVAAPVEIANYILNQKREHVAMIEARFGLSVRVEGDPALISPEYRIERFKTASRIVPAAPSLGLPKVDYPAAVEEVEPEVEEDEEETAAEAPEAAADESAGDKGNGKRRRRRRRRGGNGRPEDGALEAQEEVAAEAEDGEPIAPAAEAAADVAAEAAAETLAEPQPERSRSRRRSRSGRTADQAADAAPEAAPAPAPAAESPFGEVIDLGSETSEIVEVPEANAPQRRGKPRVRVPVAAVIAPETPTEAAPEPAPMAELAPEAPEEAVAETPRAEPEVAEAPADIAEAPAQPGFEPVEPEAPAFAPEAEAAPEPAPTAAFEPQPEAQPEPEPEATLESTVEPALESPQAVQPEPETQPEAAPEPTEPAPADSHSAEAQPAESEPLEPVAAEGDAVPSAPKRRGWWSRD